MAYFIFRFTYLKLLLVSYPVTQNIKHYQFYDLSDLSTLETRKDVKIR